MKHKPAPQDSYSHSHGLSFDGSGVVGMSEQPTVATAMHYNEVARDGRKFKLTWNMNDAAKKAANCEESRVLWPLNTLTSASNRVNTKRVWLPALAVPKIKTGMKY